MKIKSLGSFLSARRSLNLVNLAVITFLVLSCSNRVPSSSAHFLPSPVQTYSMESKGSTEGVYEAKLVEEDLDWFTNISEAQFRLEYYKLLKNKERENKKPGEKAEKPGTLGLAMSEGKLSIIQFPSVMKINLRKKEEIELYSSFGIYLLIILFGLVIIASFVLSFYIIRVIYVLICGGCRIRRITNLPPLALPDLDNPAENNIHLPNNRAERSFSLVSVPLNYANYAHL